MAILLLSLISSVYSFPQIVRGGRVGGTEDEAMELVVVEVLNGGRTSRAGTGKSPNRTLCSEGRVGELAECTSRPAKASMRGTGSGLEEDRSGKAGIWGNAGLQLTLMAWP